MAAKRTVTKDNGELQTLLDPAISAGADSAQPVIGPDRRMDLIIPAIEPGIVALTIVGLTPLLVCAWSEKARRQMLEKQMKKPKKALPAKDPQADYLASLYVSTEGWTGIPAGGVKGCLVNTCRLVDGLPMTLAKRLCFVRSQGQTKEGKQLVRVYGEHELHENPVRINNGAGTDIRFRAVYPRWSINLEIEYLKNVISAEQVANLMELAGWGEGLCEWRPGAPKNNTGDHGRFKIKRDEEPVNA